METLKDRIAVVTGGAKGIGAGIAAKLRAEGARVVIWDQDAKPGEEGAVAVDVSDPASVEAAARRTVETYGAPRILVNNAGIAGPNHKVQDYPADAWRRIIEINLIGVFLCCRALIPAMLETKRSARIVNIASVAGKEGNPLASGYSASKAGVIGLTKSLGKELAGTDLLVNCIAPAVVETDILKQFTPEFVDYMRAKIPMGRFGRVEEIAELVAWLASDACSFATGAVFDISGGRATY